MFERALARLAQVVTVAFVVAFSAIGPTIFMVDQQQTVDVMEPFGQLDLAEDDIPILTAPASATRL